MGNNNLQGITVEHLEGLQNVSVLDLRDNRIAKLPDEITLLQKLERLDLSNNDLSRYVYIRKHLFLRAYALKCTAM